MAAAVESVFLLCGAGIPVDISGGAALNVTTAAEEAVAGCPANVTCFTCARSGTSYILRRPTQAYRSGAIRVTDKLHLDRYDINVSAADVAIRVTFDWSFTDFVFDSQDPNYYKLATTSMPSTYFVGDCSGVPPPCEGVEAWLYHLDRYSSSDGLDVPLFPGHVDDGQDRTDTLQSYQAFVPVSGDGTVLSSAEGRLRCVHTCRGMAPAV